MKTDYQKMIANLISIVTSITIIIHEYYKYVNIIITVMILLIP